MYYEPGFFFYLLAFLALLVFAIGMYDNISIWRQGQEPSLRRPLCMKRIFLAFFYEVLFQTQILKQSLFRWAVHMCIFLGFLGLLAHTSFLALYQYVIPEGSALYEFFGPAQVGRLFLDAWGDLFGLLLFTGILLAVIRRYVLKEAQLDSIATDHVTLIFLGLIVLSGFCVEALRLAHEPQNEALLHYSFVGYILSVYLKGINPHWLSSFQFLHGLISLVFIAYIPFSKMMHVFTSPAIDLINASEEAERKDLYDW